MVTVTNTAELAAADAKAKADEEAAAAAKKAADADASQEEAKGRYILTRPFSNGSIFLAAGEYVPDGVTPPKSARKVD